MSRETRALFRGRRKSITYIQVPFHKVAIGNLVCRANPHTFVEHGFVHAFYRKVDNYHVQYATPTLQCPSEFARRYYRVSLHEMFWIEVVE